MELTSEFRVGVPIEQAWGVLTDVERIAPCLPGAQLQEVEGDEYRGVVKVKVGPITAQYKGRASFVEKDATAWRAVLKADGRDTRGQGNASAVVTATLVPDGDATIVKVVTDLTITGKVAQFGRGVLADVSGKLIDQFVDNLERDVLSNGNPGRDQAATGGGDTHDAAETEAGAGPADAGTKGGAGPADAGTEPSVNGGGVRRIHAPEAEPVNLLETAGAPVAKRLAPLLALLLAVLFLLRRRRRRVGADA